MYKFKPLPGYLVQSHHGWKTTTYAENRAPHERAAVIESLENLITYPFVDQAMNGSQLEIHGVVAHIDDDGLEVYDAADRAFASV